MCPFILDWILDEQRMKKKLKGRTTLIQSSLDGGAVDVEWIYQAFFLGAFRFFVNGKGSVAMSAGGVQSW